MCSSDLPPDASGEYAIRVTVNPQDIAGGPVLQEMDYANNLQFSQTILIDSSSDSADPTSRANLVFVENSYSGEQGGFRGLEPIFISFAVRNSGRSPVSSQDRISARVLLSKDQQASDSDFVLREFNLGGGGIGQGLLAGETINLTWFQQLPDNMEGDYYLLIEITNEEIGRAHV